MASMMRPTVAGKHAGSPLKNRGGVFRGGGGKSAAKYASFAASGSVPFDGTNSALRVSQLCRESIITELIGRVLVRRVIDRDPGTVFSRRSFRPRKTFP